MMSNKEYEAFTVDEWELVKNELMKAYGRLQKERDRLADWSIPMDKEERKQKRRENLKKCQAMKKAWYKAETFYQTEWYKGLGK